MKRDPHPPGSASTRKSDSFVIQTLTDPSMLGNRLYNGSDWNIKYRRQVLDDSYGIASAERSTKSP